MRPRLFEEIDAHLQEQVSAIERNPILDDFRILAAIEIHDPQRQLPACRGDAEIRPGKGHGHGGPAGYRGICTVSYSAVVISSQAVRIQGPRCCYRVKTPQKRRSNISRSGDCEFVQGITVGCLPTMLRGNSVWPLQAISPAAVKLHFQPRDASPRDHLTLESGPTRQSVVSGHCPSIGRTWGEGTVR